MSHSRHATCGDSCIQAAFEQVCKEAKPANGSNARYVVLFVHTSRYGGPEEGGWWINDKLVLAYEYCVSEEEANIKLAAVQKLAKELQESSLRDHGNQCLREMDWCEQRGLDADYLPEPDGPSEYSVEICEELPGNRYGPTHYE